MNKFIEYNHYITVNKWYRLTPQEINKLEEKGLTQKDIGEVYQRSDRTVRNWKKWIASNLQKRGRKLKIVGNALELLLSYDEDDNTATLRELSDYLFKKTGQRFSQATIFRVLEKEKVSLKKAEKQYSEQDEKKVKQFIADNSWLLSLSSFSAIDECGFNLGAVPYYARSPKGKRAIVKRPGKRGSNYTLTLCVQNVKEKAVISCKLIKGGSKTKNFHEFLSNIKFTTHLLLDNARIHHATDSCRKLKLSTIEELAIEKNIKLKYLPSYSPQLNPVEKCFSVIKSHYRKMRPRTEEDLMKVIKEAVEKLQGQDLTKYFRSCFEID